MTVYIIERHPHPGAFLPREDGFALSPGAARRADLLPPGLQHLLVRLHRDFQPRRDDLCDARVRRQEAFDNGALPDYLPRRSEACSGDWRVAPVPADLQRRRVEITGPVNATKMVINMLSRNAEGHRADCAMVDFEDSMKPTWTHVMDGVANVIGAVDGTLAYTDPTSGKHYAPDPDDMAKLLVRVRGLHLDECNVRVDGTPISAGLFDLVVTAWHTAAMQLARGQTPAFYIPKTESAREAAWWADLVAALEDHLALPSGGIKLTLLIETLPAAFEIEEILYALRRNIVALNVGRWDKIFSDIKVLRTHADRVLADRAYINLERDWMAAYALRLIRICHLRGAYALGGMAAFTPGRDAETRRAQTEKVTADKHLEASWGHDGCWVSHPYFIGAALAAFPRDNQLDVVPDATYHYPDLLPRPEGPKTLAGLRANVRVGIAYIHGRHLDLGCIAWDNLMEDLATLEISRASVAQWLTHRVRLDDGTVVTRRLVDGLFEVECERILAEQGADADAAAWRAAAEEARDLFTADPFPAYLETGSEIDL